MPGTGTALRGYGRAYLKRGGSAAWTRKEGKSESGGLNEKEEEYEGPPWPLSRNFIDSIGVDMKNVDFIKKQLPNDDPDVIRYRSVWERET